MAKRARAPKPKKTKRISFRVDPETFDQAKALAKLKGFASAGSMVGAIVGMVVNEPPRVVKPPLSVGDEVREIFDDWESWEQDNRNPIKTNQRI